MIDREYDRVIVRLDREEERRKARLERKLELGARGVESPNPAVHASKAGAPAEEEAPERKNVIVLRPVAEVEPQGPDSLRLDPAGRREARILARKAARAERQGLEL